MSIWVLLLHVRDNNKNIVNYFFSLVSITDYKVDHSVIKGISAHFNFGHSALVRYNRLFFSDPTNPLSIILKVIC